MTAQIIYCECCNVRHSGDYGSGRFCSSKCSRSFSTKSKRNEINQKVSQKLKGRETGRKGKLTKKRFEVCCIICGSVFKDTDVKSRKTCGSASCIHQQKVEAGKKSASKRKSRSRLEKEFYTLCEKHFKVDHNKPIANGWDADVLLLDHKVAVLWNGPWHYREMEMSNHSLKQVVNRDILKIIEFEKIGWDVVIYEDDKWTPEEAFIDLYINMVEDRGYAPLP